MKNNLAVLIPTYNEAQNIELLLEKIKSCTGRLSLSRVVIYVIDDSSPDGTARVVERMKVALETENFFIHLLHRSQKQGLGKAYIDGFRALLAQPDCPDYVLQMDADLSHHPESIPAFVEAMRAGAELVVGSRYIPGGSCPEWKWYRRALSEGGNRYARFVLGSSVSDYTGGFNLFSKNLLHKLDFGNLDHSGYGFLIHLKYEASRVTSKIAQVPIQFSDREYGVSKMPLSTVWRNFILVLSLKFKTLSER